MNKLKSKYPKIMAISIVDSAFNEALEVANKVTTLTPDDPFAWLNLAGIRINTRKYAEAKVALEKTIQLDASQHNAFYYLGIVEQQLGNNKDAEMNYNKALEINPSNEKIRVALANFYTRSEMYQKASDQYAELAKYIEPTGERWFTMAKLSAKNAKFQLALEQLENALKSGFKNVQKIEDDPMLTELRTTDAYGELKAKYF